MRLLHLVVPTLLSPVCRDGYPLGDDAVVPEDYHDVDLEVDREQVCLDSRTAKMPENTILAIITNFG